MRTRRTKIAPALSAVAILAAALLPTAASAWEAKAQNHTWTPTVHFRFNLNVGAEHTTITRFQVASPCVTQSGVLHPDLFRIKHLAVGSQSGLHLEGASSLTFQAEAPGLRFTLLANLRPGWAGELLDQTAHVTVSSPGLCHEEVGAMMIATIFSGHLFR
jgi:hypothetical protein